MSSIRNRILRYPILIFGLWSVYWSPSQKWFWKLIKTSPDSGKGYFQTFSHQNPKTHKKMHFSYIIKVSNELHTYLIFYRIFHWVKSFFSLKGIFKLHFFLSTPFVYPQMYGRSSCCFYRHIGITFFKFLSKTVSIKNDLSLCTLN